MASGDRFSWSEVATIAGWFGFGGVCARTEGIPNGIVRMGEGMVVMAQELGNG